VCAVKVLTPRKKSSHASLQKFILVAIFIIISVIFNILDDIFFIPDENKLLQRSVGRFSALRGENVSKVRGFIRKRKRKSLLRLFALAEGHFHKIVVGAIEDIDIYVATDAVDFSGIGMLPKAPGTFVNQGVNVVVGNPVGIAVEVRGVQVGGLEFVGGIEDGRDAIVALHDLHPVVYFRTKFLWGEVADVLHVEHRGKVLVLQLYDFAKEKSLTASRCLCAEEMVGTPHDVVFTGVIEILVKVLVDDVGALGGLDEDEAEGNALELRPTKLPPVDVLLIVAHVDATDFPVGIGHGAVEGFPTKRIGRDEGLVEENNVDEDDQTEQSPKQKRRKAAKRIPAVPAPFRRSFPDGMSFLGLNH